MRKKKTLKIFFFFITQRFSKGVLYYSGQKTKDANLKKEEKNQEEFNTLIKLTKKCLREREKNRTAQ